MSNAEYLLLPHVLRTSISGAINSVCHNDLIVPHPCDRRIPATDGKEIFFVATDRRDILLVVADGKEIFIVTV